MISAALPERLYERIGDRKAVALELIAREIDGILAGDDRHPSHWLRIIDVCRQEAGLPPMYPPAEIV